MTASNKPASRFLPTLTEVVQPPLMAPADPVASVNAVDQAVLLASAELEQKLQALIPALVREQVDALLPRLNEEIQAALRAAVEQALAGLNTPKN